ncbi:MAG TPA: VOC family protein [Acidimicrobiia bacterium]|nr:VOC family protein [Acidimicrobiia bacterium]
MASQAVEVRGITIDVADLARAKAFWTQLLGVATRSESESYVWLSEIAPGVRLVLQRVPDVKTSKNRVHLEIVAEDTEPVITRVEAMGGTRVRDLEAPEYALTVMSDPDGNEFCLNRRPSVGLVESSEMP